MILTSAKFLKENMKLAQPVINDKGQVLISDGVELTARMISRLNEIGISFVYIEDERTIDVDAKHPLSAKTRLEAVQAVQEAFDILEKDKDLAHSFVFSSLGKKFSNVVTDILDDLRSHNQAISLMSEAYVYDNYIFTHSLNVTVYALALGMQLNLPKKNLEEIGLGALLHDIGKTVIPLEILTKPGKLTHDEYTIIKTHAEHGFNILRKIPGISVVTAHCAYQHHERIDGSGYPRGLKGNDIHPYSRILGVADVYDAVTSNRVYRKAMLPHEGLEILYAGAGSQFDQHLVEAFRQAIAVYPIGMSVMLNDERKGVVVQQNENVSERPIIRILEEKGTSISTSYEIDLSQELTVTITGVDMNE